MNAKAFPHLFTPLTIRGTTLRNRIMSTGHDTLLPHGGQVSDEYIAYQEARARGGAGLIVTQVAGVHETARYTAHLLMATDDDCIPGFRKLAEACHAHGAVVISQLFHPGREIMEGANGLLAVSYSASAVPNERFKMMPRAMDKAMIDEVVQGYADAARRMWQAGFDGVEFVGSHGYLPAQFLNPLVNLRTDGYGGSPENRLRFLQEALAAMRAATDENFIIGMRLSASERDEGGLTIEDALQASRALQEQLDYLSLTVGTSATLGGAVHITAPMNFPAAYVAPEVARFKKALTIPVFATGRINQPQEAEAMLARGEADVCGMTRALICDPVMPNKAEAGQVDDIRACIGCNQACIHHFHKGLSISCIQHPETGRELRFGSKPQAASPRKIMVIGGGPAGLKAAATAAERGHDVTLYEAAAQLGGQALLAQLLPHRAEFGGIITNLASECGRAGVTIVKGQTVDAALIDETAPDAIILATGAVPFLPDIESDGEMQILGAWEVLRREARAGARVVIADWRADWIGMGLAEMLAADGSNVRLAVNAPMAGDTIPYYVRDTMLGNLHRLGVEVIPYARLFGTQDDTVFLQHTASQEPIILEGVDSLVLSLGHRPQDDLQDCIRVRGIELHQIGDAMSPRTAEEAVYEGMIAGTSV
ncbi:FAD-binding protein (plasmid) [Pseudorhodobacter turbinis]|uniref:FAD-binding protein n=1 Tax=Pseudorhodobacter turbinis TaxID=2500533 RepID=A0A4P8EK24_9RHOB|nr:FAD-dependent oxidoreductase [Pseudorhodobacter turbinis]QCO57222.1 FAD-binding protein [Pseudorhodobacter turbinis]